MKRDRIRCKRCRAALRKAPDIPERIELWAYHEEWVDDEIDGERFRYPTHYPALATAEQIAANMTWREYFGPYWTCQRCKFENDADHVGEEDMRVSRCYDDYEPPGY